MEQELDPRNFENLFGNFIIIIFFRFHRRRRSRSRPRSHHNGYEDLNESAESVPSEPRTMLMTNEEALHSLYGEISTERDGDLTHQCIQTNLADVICGGKFSEEKAKF